MRDTRKTVAKMRDQLYDIANAHEKLQRISDATSAAMLEKILHANFRIQDGKAVAKIARLFIETSNGCGYSNEGIAKKTRLPIALVRDITCALEQEGFIYEHQATCCFWSLRLNMETK